MGTFFGIGLFEVITIIIVATWLMGPIEIFSVSRRVTREFGRLLAQMQGLSREFARQLNTEIDEIENPGPHPTLWEIRDLQQELLKLRQELSAATSPALTEEKETESKTFSVEQSMDIDEVEEGADDSEVKLVLQKEDKQNNLPNIINVEDDPEG
jgi:hypothetical protein